MTRIYSMEGLGLLEQYKAAGEGEVLALKALTAAMQGGAGNRATIEAASAEFERIQDEKSRLLQQLQQYRLDAQAAGGKAGGNDAA